MRQQKPLRPDQTRAAALLGQGRSHSEVATEVGTTTTSVGRWLRRDDFNALVKQARKAVLDENPSVRSVLEAGLSATLKNGSPSWNVRLQAARLLMRLNGDEGADDDTDGEVRETIVYLPEDPDEDT